MNHLQGIRDTLITSGLKPPKIGLARVHEVFTKRLLIEDVNAITVCIASAIANRLPGDPCWLFFVLYPVSESGTDKDRELRDS